MEMDTEKAGNGYGANPNVDTSMNQQTADPAIESSSLMQVRLPPIFALKTFKEIHYHCISK